MRHQLFIIITPETFEHLGDFLVPYAKKFLKEVVNMDMKELSKVPMEEVRSLYSRKDKKYRFIQVDKETYEGWKAIPGRLKRRASYLVYKKLMEVKL